MSPYPHRLVAMGYNTVPDGRGFTDDNVDWDPPYQRKYSTVKVTNADLLLNASSYFSVCHSEVNAIITAFRR